MPGITLNTNFSFKSCVRHFITNWDITYLINALVFAFKVRSYCIAQAILELTV